MRLSHLTFAQLHRLGSPVNLCRITRVYHTALRKAWSAKYDDRTWDVRHSEGQLPEIAGRYRPVLDFLRGPRVKEAIRLAADAQTVPHIPGGDYLIRSLPYIAGLNEQDRYNLALILRAFCEAAGVPARVCRAGNAFEVRADTNGWGMIILLYRTGTSLGSLRLFCADGNINFHNIFWWIPLGTSFSARVNPLRVCLNTPDINENAADLIHLPELASAGN